MPRKVAFPSFVIPLGSTLHQSHHAQFGWYHQGKYRLLVPLALRGKIVCAIGKGRKDWKVYYLPTEGIVSVATKDEAEILAVQAACRHLWG